MSEQKHTQGPLQISRVNDGTKSLLLKPIPGQVVCEIDRVPAAEANARLLAASYNAFDSAAKRLNVNAVELAERLADGGIADLVEQLRHVLGFLNTHEVKADGGHPLPVELTVTAVLAKLEGRA